ncbi:MAG: YihY/virulence factor BrkB family protein [Bacteroidota bacterium]
MKKRLNQLQQFIEVDVWRLKLRNLPKRRRIAFATVRVLIISIKEFIRDKCSEKASALTYFSMLSLVPVIAMLVAIAKAFGIRELMEQELAKYFSGQEAILENVLPYADRMLSGTSGGIVTGISIVFLIFTVIRLLMNIEAAFNDMWDIKKSRRWERKISDYVAVILLGPVLLIVASSATIFVKDTIQDFMNNLSLLDELKSGIVFLLKFLPYTILWLLLFGIYLIFPNTRVKPIPALIAGVVAGTLYQLNQQAFISAQFAFARIDAIYGSIAFLPLFLIWLQISWLIVLFGAEVCYGVQYINHWEMNSEKLKLSLSHRRKLTLLLLYRIVKRFEEQDKGGLTLNEIADAINIPRRYIVDICFDLEKAGLIIRTESEDIAYLPTFDIHKMDLYTVLDKYEHQGMEDFDPRKTEVFKSIENVLEEINLKWKNTNCNKLVKDL